MSIFGRFPKAFHSGAVIFVIIFFFKKSETFRNHSSVYYVLILLLDVSHRIFKYGKYLAGNIIVMLHETFSKIYLNERSIKNPVKYLSERFVEISNGFQMFNREIL